MFESFTGIRDYANPRQGICALADDDSGPGEVTPYFFHFNHRGFIVCLQL